MPKTKIMVTSVGSLVGQNILDVIDSSVFPRRDKLTIVGTNSLAGSPNNFRCDRCYLLPNTSHPDFTQAFVDIVSDEKPDLILSGRDEDTEKVATIMRDNPNLSGRLPYGEVETLRIALNKWDTWLFAQRHNLPFASAFVMGKSGGLDELKAFVDLYSYPLIAKPIQGFASKGVFFVRNWTDAELLSGFKDYMFQEYLGDGSTLESYFRAMDGPTPLFAHAPNIFHHSCHTLIGPDGTIAPIFISRNEHDSGTTIGFRKVEHPQLESIARNYAEALYKEGGCGPLTVQFREDKDGNWKAQEMNLRTNGNTLPRFLMGQDDLGLIMNAFLPDIDFPTYEAPESTKAYIIGKSLHSHVMNPDEIETLKSTGSIEF